MALKDLMELIRAPAVLTLLRRRHRGRHGGARPGRSIRHRRLRLVRGVLRRGHGAERLRRRRPRPDRAPRRARSRGVACRAGRRSASPRRSRQADLAATSSAGPRALRIRDRSRRASEFYDLIGKKTALGPLSMAVCPRARCDHRAPPRTGGAPRFFPPVPSPATPSPSPRCPEERCTALRASRRSRPPSWRSGRRGTRRSSAARVRAVAVAPSDP